jgi:hypothetical protein
MTQIVCPKCNHEFSADAALTDQIEKHLREELTKSNEEEKRRLRAEMLKWQEDKEKDLAQKEKDFTTTLTEQLKKELAEQSTQETAALKKELEQKQEQIRKAQELELQLRQQKNELDQKMQQVELETQRKLDAEREKIRKEAEEMVLEKQRMRDAEKDKQIDDMRQKIEELQLKANLTSQQLQGEVQELELETVLRNQFPFDEITEVPKGMNGADVMQKVYNQMGKYCGTIIWESKRTKNWSGEWTAKLKDDLRASKSDVAILVSSVLPDDVKHFGAKDGVYVTDFENFLPVAKMIRMQVIELCLAKDSTVNQEQKTVILYNYIRSNEFTQKVEAIVEAFQGLKEDLEKEKNLYTRMWAKREKQIQRVLDNTIGMYGDLQGLIGSSLPEIKALELDNFEMLDLPEVTITSSTKTVVQADLLDTALMPEIEA